MKRVFSIVAFAAAASLVTGEGKTQTVDTLMGRWCNSTTAYAFTRDKLVVTYINGAPYRVLRIQKIEAGDGSINVHWDPPDGGNTIFSHFSGNAMQQDANTGGDMGPKLTFHRC